MQISSAVLTATFSFVGQFKLKPVCPEIGDNPRLVTKRSVALGLQLQWSYTDGRTGKAISIFRIFKKYHLIINRSNLMAYILNVSSKNPWRLVLSWGSIQTRVWWRLGYWRASWFLPLLSASWLPHCLCGAQAPTQDKQLDLEPAWSPFSSPH